MWWRTFVCLCICVCGCVYVCAHVCVCVHYVGISRLLPPHGWRSYSRVNVVSLITVKARQLTSPRCWGWMTGALEEMWVGGCCRYLIPGTFALSLPLTHIYITGATTRHFCSHLLQGRSDRHAPS